MKLIAALVLLVASAPLWAITPSIGESYYRMSELECPPGEACASLNESYCSQGNIEISPNADNSFDIVFNNFNVTTSSNASYASASCLLEIPIRVPTGYQINLKEVSVGGVTVVPSGGRSSASVTHFFGGRESTRIESFVNNEAFVVTHAQELNADYSTCGRGDAVVGTRVDITASRAQSSNTFVNLSSGAGKLQYILDYKECTPEPEVCNEKQFEIDGVCYNIADSCGSYHVTSSAVCNNTYDELTCDWDVNRNLCYSECKSYQFEYNGNCYDKATQCSAYDNTSKNICNNGSDNLHCDWMPSDNSCRSNCPNGTFKIDGQCYLENGSCSQYNNTNSNTCNTGSDNLSCDWIPSTYGNSSLINTCVSQCPSDSFEKNGQCFQVNGQCSQYNGTDSNTCNTSRDNLQCDWNSKNKTCYAD